METNQGADAVALRIAVVEDDADTRLVMAELLCSLHHDVVTFPSAEAIWMHSELEKIDLFLLDIGLPGLNGNALCRSLRSVCVDRKTVVVAVSGKAGGEPQALSAGFDEYIVKPLNLTRLQRILDSVTNRRTISNPSHFADSSAHPANRQWVHKRQSPSVMQRMAVFLRASTQNQNA